MPHTWWHLRELRRTAAGHDGGRL